MAIKSGFFNAILSAGQYDRQYNADDYTDNLAVVISDGVCRTINDDFRVVANGLNLIVRPGYAFIKGHYCHNTTEYSLPSVVPPQGGTRIDRVVLRLDKSITVRSISVVYLEGTTEAPELTRNDVIYDLCLAEITSTAGSAAVSVKDTRGDADLCGWVYSTAGDGSFFTSLDNQFDEWFENVKDTLSSVTLFKRYMWQTVLEAQQTEVAFNIPQYDAETCFFDVYVNGFLVHDYTANDNVITFAETLNAGTVITVNAYKSIDGTGIMTVADEITELQNKYAAISGVGKFVYTAKGTNDNVILSEIAQAFAERQYSDITAEAEAFLENLGGNEYLASLGADAEVTISVVGKLGVAAAYSGSGTDVSPYKWFVLANGVTFDFSGADAITVNCVVGTYNTIFSYGKVKNVVLSATNGTIKAIDGSAENARIEISATGDGYIATRGEHINCRYSVKSTGGNATVFLSEGEFIRVIGGTFKAYNSAEQTYSAVFYTNGYSSESVIVATNINCPTVAISGFSQQYAAIGYSGATVIDVLVSPLSSVGDYVTVGTQINKNKTE